MHPCVDHHHRGALQIAGMLQTIWAFVFCHVMVSGGNAPPHAPNTQYAPRPRVRARGTPPGGGRGNRKSGYKSLVTNEKRPYDLLIVSLRAFLQTTFYV